jgi:hypothetical protein
MLMPDLLGADGRQEYLLINQNPDELRPTGGFIGSAGPVVFEAGRLIEQDVTPTGESGPYSRLLYPPPPLPLQRYMALPVWIFRDANWSPDFRTSALDILNLYALERGQTFDNVMAIDPRAVQLLLQATGPVSVEGSEKLVTAANVQLYMRDQYNLGLAQEDIGKKDFISNLMQAIVSKLETDFTDIDLLVLLRVLCQALNERHIMFYVADPEIAGLLAKKGWDGAIQPGNHDFLMVVGANVGYNKANPNVRQAVTYEIDLRNPDEPAATVIVQHRNVGDTPIECRHWAGRMPRFSSYEDSAVDCYWDYLRMLIPQGSPVSLWETPTMPGAWIMDGLEYDFDGNNTLSSDGPAGTYVLSTFLVVAPGGEHTTTVHYHLPSDVLTRTDQGWHYQLRIQKQPGREAPPYQLRVHVPPGTTGVSSSYEPDRQTDATLSFSFDLARDYVLDVWFQE